MKRFSKLISSVIVMCMVLTPQYGYSLPKGENVISGQATYQTDGNTLNINVTTDKMIAEYNSFSIGAPETVNFNQLSSSSVALNRVIGVDPSSIMGKLNATGKIFLINPNGVLFGAGASVNAAGLVASTLDIANDDFLAGRYTFYGNGGSVVNQGYISAPGGFVALLGNRVENSGVIETTLGSVALAAGEAITIDLDVAGLISVVVDKAVTENLEGAQDAVKNSGTISANGGRVILTAEALEGVFDKAINNIGIIEAKSLVGKKGEVRLLSAQENALVSTTGTIDVSASDEGADGGFVEVSGPRVIVDGTIDVTSAFGDAGELLIDPWDLHIVSPNYWGEWLSFPYFPDGSYVYEAWLENFKGNLTIEALNDISFDLDGYYTSRHLEGPWYRLRWVYEGWTADNELDLSNLGEGETFTLNAGRNINLNDNIVRTDGADIVFNADKDFWYETDGEAGQPKQWTNTADGIGDINLGTGSLISNGGDVELNAGADVNFEDGLVISDGGDVRVKSDADFAYDEHEESGYNYKDWYKEYYEEEYWQRYRVGRKWKWRLATRTSYKWKYNWEYKTTAYSAEGAETTADGIGDIDLGTGSGIDTTSEISGNVELDGVNVNLSSLVNADGAKVMVTAVEGITDSDDAGAVDVIADELVLDAGQSIGSDNAIETNVNYLAARITGLASTAGININNTSSKGTGLNLTDLNSWGYAVGISGTGNAAIITDRRLDVADDVVTNGGDVELTARKKVGLAGLIDASDGDVTITSQESDINDNNGKDLNVIADKLTMTAVKGIGGKNKNKAIDTQVSELTAYNSEDGNIGVSNTGDLELADEGVINDGGDVSIYNEGNLSFANDIIGENIKLDVSGQIDMGFGADVTAAILANIKADSLTMRGFSEIDADEVLITLDGDMSMTWASSIEANESALITLDGDMKMSWGSSIESEDVTIESDSLTMQDFSYINAGELSLDLDGDLDMQGYTRISVDSMSVEADNLSMQRRAYISVDELDVELNGDLDMQDSTWIYAEDSVYVSADGDIGLTWVGADDVTLDSNGEIIDNNDSWYYSRRARQWIKNEATNIEADTINLSAKKGIGSDNTIETETSELSAYNRKNGDINISNTGDLELGGEGVINESGNVTLENNGDLDFTNEVSGRNVNLLIDGDVNMMGSASIYADKNVDVSADNIGITSIEADKVELDAEGAIVNNNQEFEGGDDFEGRAPRKPMIARTNITANKVKLNANQGIGDEEAIVTEISSLTAYNGEEGNINIDNSGALTIDRQGVVNDGGSVDITTHSPLTIDSKVNATGDITLTAENEDGDITVNANLESAGGDIVLVADSDIVVNNSKIKTQSEESDSSVEIVLAANNVTLNDSVLKALVVGDDSDSAVIIEAANNIVAINNMRSVIAKVIGENSQAHVEMSAGGNIEMTSAGVKAVTDSGNTFVIMDAGDDIVQSAGSKIRTAGGDVMLAADTDADGNGGITQSADSSVVTEGGDIFATAGVSPGVGGEDILLGTMDAGTGNVFIGAGLGSILDNNGDAVNIISGATELWAYGDIGASNDFLDTNTSVINAESQTGDINIEEANSVRFNEVTAMNGHISLLAHGETVLGQITGRDLVNIRTSQDDIIIDGRVESTESGVGITTDTGDVLVTSAGPHIVAADDSFINAPYGKITPTGLPLHVMINGYLMMNITNNDITVPQLVTFANLIGEVLGGVPLLYPTSYPQPLNPPGFVYFNGKQIWPPTSQSAFLQFSQLTHSSFLKGYYEFLDNHRMISFDQVTPTFYAYHPLTETDSSAFNDIALDPDAYEFIDDNLKFQDSLSSFFGDDEEDDDEEPKV